MLNVSGKQVNSFYCVLRSSMYCILSHLILSTLRGGHSFHFTVNKNKKQKNRKRINNIAQVIPLLNGWFSSRDFAV